MISGPVYYNQKITQLEDYFLTSIINGKQIIGKQIIFECEEGYQAKIKMEAQKPQEPQEPQEPQLTPPEDFKLDSSICKEGVGKINLFCRKEEIPI